MRSVTPHEMRRYDELAGQRYGIPSVLLMENAGRATADAAIEMLRGRKGLVVCVCGKGNNGGDGFVATRHLFNRGVRVVVFCAAQAASLSGDAAVNAEILRRMGVKRRRLATTRDAGVFIKTLRRAALVIDAVFGIGFHGSVPEFYRSIFETIHASRRPVLAVDVPSGLNALTGVGPDALVASRTVTFGLAKKGLFKKDGPRCAGRIEVADISIPRQLLTPRKRSRGGSCVR